MTEMLEQLAALASRLKDLEMQAGQLGEKTPPDTTAATPGPPSTTSTIKVSVPCKRTFGRCGGVNCWKIGSLMLREFLEARWTVRQSTP